MGKKRGERISPFSFGWSTRNGVEDTPREFKTWDEASWDEASLNQRQRKKRIFGLPGIIAPATSVTTITITSSILPPQYCRSN